jgi:hypothetical protein
VGNQKLVYTLGVGTTGGVVEVDEGTAATAAAIGWKGVKGCGAQPHPVAEVAEFPTEVGRAPVGRERWHQLLHRSTPPATTLLKHMAHAIYRIACLFVLKNIKRKLHTLSLIMFPSFHHHQPLPIGLSELCWPVDLLVSTKKCFSTPLWKQVDPPANTARIIR